MALSAQVAVARGAQGIDINFGCPAPTVNRHDGGATLLKFPERIEAIVRAVRSAVPIEYPVSAKLRLGWDDPRAIIENSERAARGGASWITIHGRTKMQGYTPPAYWKPIAAARRNLSIPVVANGEIWSLDDLKRCEDESHCRHFMIGRGALARPSFVSECAHYLGLPIAARPCARGMELADLSGTSSQASPWPVRVGRVIAASKEREESERKTVSRIKQWLNYAHKYGERAAQGPSYLGEPISTETTSGAMLFEQIKRVPELSAIEKVLAEHLAYLSDYACSDAA
jgi:tRNA-dihydrouridine synthase C